MAAAEEGATGEDPSARVKELEAVEAAALRLREASRAHHEARATLERGGGTPKFADLERVATLLYAVQDAEDRLFALLDSRPRPVGDGDRPTSPTALETTLTTGHAILIDAADAPLLNQYRWGANRLRGSLRVYCHLTEEGRQRTLYLGRVITGAKRGQFVAHRNGNLTDFRRANLQILDHRPGLPPTERRICPFSKEKLRELYEQEGKGAIEIGKIASALMGWDPPTSGEMVRRWLLWAGIKPRGRGVHPRLSTLVS